MEFQEYGIRILMALLLGSMIGLEREWRQRMAGLRTNAMVCVGACLFVLLSVTIAADDSSPSRIASQVVSGLGFLGGGVILREGLNIKGLTTAATIWCTGAVGVLLGWGELAMGLTGAVAILVINILLRPLQKKIQSDYVQRKGTKSPYCLLLVCSRQDEAGIRNTVMDFVEAHPFTLLSMNSEDTDIPDEISIKVDLLLRKRNFRLLEELAQQLRATPSVSSIRWNYLLDNS